MARTAVSAGGQDRRKAEDLSKSGVSEDVALERGRDLVAGKLEQTLLMVDDQEDGVLLVKPVVGKRKSCATTKQHS